LKFVNPFYREQTVQVQVHPGETATVQVALKPKHATTARSIPSP
jgi:hypothetical protein